jgi:hypothetical protein
MGKGRVLCARLDAARTRGDRSVMKTYLGIAMAASLAACAHTVDTSSTSVTIARWEQRHVSELIDAVGPFDTTSIKGDSRAYNWFRFGNCRLTALTSLEGKIQKLELEGTGTGCEVYQQKLGA